MSVGPDHLIPMRDSSHSNGTWISSSGSGQEGQVTISQGGQRVVVGAGVVVVVVVVGSGVVVSHGGHSVTQGGHSVTELSMFSNGWQGEITSPGLLGGLYAGRTK